MRVSRNVIRAGGLLGVSGGALRAIGSFAPMLIASESTRAELYLVIDICLVSGLLSIYAALRQGITAVGSVGFLVALSGLIATRTSAALSRIDLYAAFAAMVAVGILVLAFSAWRSARVAAWVPVTFALSLVMGSVGTFVAGAGPLFVLSGILFGVAFAAMASIAYTVP
jgi:hypothetical protein